MNCKNCGAKLKDSARVCPNCGAFVDDESGYTMITADDRIDDFYSSEKKPQPKKRLRRFLIALLVILLAGGGSYLYFGYIAPMNHKAPEMSFSTGAGLINGDEKVIYAAIDDKGDMEYIHGVSLYRTPPSDPSASSETGQEPLLTSLDYEYTKNVDDTFRAVYFDTADLDLNKNEEYTYYFQIAVSYLGSDRHYYYTCSVNFSGDITEDVSDIIFDRSMYETNA